MQQANHVLVTGGAGYIGSHVVWALLDHKIPVVVIDDLSTGFRWLLPDDVPFYQAGIQDESTIDTICSSFNINCVMNFAGSIVVPESVINPLKYYSNNISNSLSLITSCIRNNIPNFIFSSTAAVYGIPDKIPLDEQSPTRPVSPYGHSKLVMEQILQDCHAAYGLGTGVLRYFNVAGADPKGRCGQATREATHLIKIATEAALGKRPEVLVFGQDYPTQDGTGVRDYIHVSDLAHAHLLLYQRLKDKPGQALTFNCGYNRGFSVLEVLDAIDKIADKPLKRVMSERRPGDASILQADNQTILRELSWQPTYDDLDIIVQSALDWERALDEKRSKFR